MNVLSEPRIVEEAKRGSWNELEGTDIKAKALRTGGPGVIHGNVRQRQPSIDGRAGVDLCFCCRGDGYDLCAMSVRRSNPRP